MNSFTRFTAIAVLAITAIGCTGEVPPGHLARRRTPDGFTADVLAPGRQSCMGRDRLYLLEVSDKQFTVKMDVLCTDELNFGFVVGVLAAVDKTNTQAIREVFENVTPSAGTEGTDCIYGIITADQLFEMYVKPVVDQESRKVVSKYKTREIVSNRTEIIEEIRATIKQALKGTLVTAKRITVNNLDFPAVITKAQEDRAKREVEIQTEQAEQRKRLIQARNQLNIEEVQYQRELVEAAKVADANRIIGASITPQYLAFKQLEVIRDAASGPNNWGFIPYTDAANAKVNIGRWASPQGIVDAELLRRIQSARDSAKDALVEEEAANAEAEAKSKPKAKPAAPPAKK